MRDRCGVAATALCGVASMPRLGSLALLSGAALREYATSLQNFAAAMRLSPRDPARAPMMPQSDAGMDNQLCFKLMRGPKWTPEVVRANVTKRSSRGVERLKARVERRKSLPVLASKGASGSAQLQLQSAALAQSFAGSSDAVDALVTSHCSRCTASKPGKRGAKAIAAALPPGCSGAKRAPCVPSR